MHQGSLFPDPRSAEADEVVFDLPDAELRLVRGFLPAACADALFAHLRDDVPWDQEQLVMFGRVVPSPRLTAWYGDPGSAYRYSGIRHEPIPWTPSLRDLRQRVEAASGTSCNSALLNYYRDGNDSVSWHSDDERDLGPSPAIASVSLGASRVFQLQHKTREDLGRVDIVLPHGSLLIMAGDCQRCWRHQLPKRRGRNDPGPRINLTFRRVRPASASSWRSTLRS